MAYAAGSSAVAICLGFKTVDVLPPMGCLRFLIKFIIPEGSGDSPQFLPQTGRKLLSKLRCCEARNEGREWRDRRDMKMDRHGLLS